MPDAGDLLAAIADARARRLRCHAIRCKIAIAILAATAAAIVVITWSLHAPTASAMGAERTASLSIEDAIMDAIDAYDEFPEVDWEHWLGVNPDIVGWVTIEGTAIDHPIVKALGESPAFYLSHGIDGDADGKGCIFLDAECEDGLESMHSVVYGHNWAGGLMFADLAKYADAEFAQSHPRILLQTPSWKERLEVQCIEMANGTDDSNVIAFESAEAMAGWYRDRYRASSLQLGEERVGMRADRIYTFCTCADGPGDKRVLVYAMPSTKRRAASRDSASTA